MRRNFYSLTLGLILALGTVGFAGAGAAAASPATSPALFAHMAGSSASQVRASTDDFTFASLEADYFIGRDAEGHSTLRTLEKLVAEFPASDQNHGIRRAIPNHYDGRPVELQIVSVTDENGAPRSYETEEDEDNSDFTLVTIAANDFVHGQQTYVIEYTQRYVTMVPDDATADNANEFYWDVNGTGWAQPFGTVTARVHVDPEIADRFTGQTACYQGFEKSTQKCDELTVADTGNETVVQASASDLQPGQNLTVGVGFTADTFVPRDSSYLASGTGYVQLIGLAGLIAALLIGLVCRLTRWRDHPGRGTIIPEYLPPKGINLLVASDLHGTASKATAAEFLDMAVRHNIRVLEEPATSVLRSKPRYVLELLTPAGLDAQERALATALFGKALTPGSRRDLSKTDSALGPKIYKVASSAKKSTATDGYRRRPAGHMRALVLWLGTGMFALSAVFGVITAADELGGAVPLLLLVAAGILYFFTLATVSNVRPVTEKGAELRDYLRGLEVYIKLAETDRLRVLQSPTGALRTDYRPAGENPWSNQPSAPVVAADGQIETRQIETRQIVKLYEKLLPYAVLFGLEKDWAKQLGEYYERDNSQPDWYSGSTAFNAGLFAAGIGSLSSTASSSWSGSSSNSSSGGSGGGGFSGGGGGGGGGGGV